MLIASILQPIFGLFGVMDPVGNTPVFLALTSEETPARRRAIALRAVIRAAFILVAFTLVGNGILDIFAISLGSFRIAGGLVLAILGFQIMFDISFGSAPKEVTSEGLDISMVPLATPLIAGPGAISMSIVLVKEYGYWLTLLGIFVNLLLTLVAFWGADWLHKMLGRQGSEAFAKIMGLIVVAVGIELIRKGITG